MTWWQIALVVVYLVAMTWMAWEIHKAPNEGDL